MGGYTLMQDGARAHTARATLQYLTDRNVNFLTPEQWPPFSPDLNVMDFAIWPLLAQKVYRSHKSYTSIQTLKQAIMRAWDEIEIQHIRSAVRDFPRRASLIVEENGKHIEHIVG